MNTASIIVTNARLAAALLAAAIAVCVVPAWRCILDAVVGFLIAVNVLAVGAALGEHGVALARHLAHLPLEWGGIAIAGAGYLRARHVRVDGRELGTLACASLAMLSVGAVVEVHGLPGLG